MELYHVTVESNIEAIAREGLTPKDRKSKFHYSKRLYLLQNYEDLPAIIEWVTADKDEQAVVLIIDATGVELHEDLEYEWGEAYYIEKKIVPGRITVNTLALTDEDEEVSIDEYINNYMD